MKNNRSLISVLKDLYSQLSQISLGMTQFRLNTYKRDVKPQSNISSLLHKQIEDISSQATARENNAATNAKDVDIKAGDKEQKKPPVHKDAKVENVTGVKNELVKYLKQRRPVNVTQPHMGENLKASAWEHINAAKRCAKSGNLEAAKLHTDIAGTALEEAGNYMSNEDYSSLVLDIEVYLSEPSK